MDYGYIDVTEKHIKEFGSAIFTYYERHQLKDGKVVRKCRDTWNCDCSYVMYSQE